MRLVLYFIFFVPLVSFPSAHAAGKIKNFIDWCQGKLVSRSHDRNALEKSVKQSEKVLRTIEEVVALSKLELDRPAEEIAKIHQAKELYYQISE